MEFVLCPMKKKEKSALVIGSVEIVYNHAHTLCFLNLLSIAAVSAFDVNRCVQ